VKRVSDGNVGIYVMNGDTSGQRNLTRKPGDDVFPACRAANA
jgi:Tol biopolymer transport system component